MALCDEVTVLRDGNVEMSARAARGADRAGDRRRDARRAARRGRARREAAGGGRRVGRRRRGGGRLELRDASVTARWSRSRSRCARARSSGWRASRAPATTPCSSWSADCAGPTPARCVLPGGRPVPHGLRRAIRAGRRARHRRPAAARADARQADLGEHRPDPLGRARRRRRRSCARASCARAGARARRPACASAAARSISPPARCRAATSRRSCSPSGSTRSRRWSCSTTRRAASTSAPRPRCTR